MHKRAVVSHYSRVLYLLVLTPAPATPASLEIEVGTSVQFEEPNMASKSLKSFKVVGK